MVRVATVLAATSMESVVAVRIESHGPPVAVGGSESMVDRVILPPATSGVHIRVVLDAPLDVNAIVGPAAGVLDGPEVDAEVPSTLSGKALVACFAHVATAH